MLDIIVWLEGCADKLMMDALMWVTLDLITLFSVKIKPEGNSHSWMKIHARMASMLKIGV